MIKISQYKIMGWRLDPTGPPDMFIVKFNSGREVRFLFRDDGSMWVDPDTPENREELTEIMAEYLATV